MNKRRLLSLALALALCLSLVPAALAAEGDFTIDDNHVLIKYNGPGGDVVIPDGVTAIGEMAFFRCTSLTSVTIPDGVTTIGYEAFRNCSSLTSVTIPDGVTTIGYEAFLGCESLTSVTIPDSVTTIGDSAFDGCVSLTSITIPNGVTYIGDYAFDGCTGLTSVTIPDGVTTIGYEAFRNCSSLTSVTIPDSVTTIDYAAFYGCKSLTSVTIPDSVTDIGSKVFASCSNLAGIEVADGNKTYCSLDGVLFTKDMTVLIQYPGAKRGSVTIPNSVTTIKQGAFDGCESLTSITIPDSVTYMGMGYMAFVGCSSLVSIEVDEGNKELCSLDGVVFFKDMTDLIQYPTGKQGSFTIPDSVVGIQVRAFEGCTGLTSVTIPNSVTYINPVAFRGCIGLTSVTIPDSVTDIGDYAFDGCTGLTSVIIPDSVTYMEDYVFGNCPKLTLYGKAGSYAQTYAKEYNIPFVVLGSGPVPGVPGEDKLTLDKSTVSVKTGKTATVTATVTGYEGKHVYAISDDASVASVSVRDKKITVKGEAVGSTSVYVIMSDTTAVTLAEAKADPSMKEVKVTVTKASSGGGGNPGGNPGGNGGTVIPGGNGGGGGAPAPETKPASEVFTDVVKDSWYEAGVSYVVENKLFQGVGNGSFAPMQTMTRGMLMTVLARKAGVDTSKGATWFEAGMNWSVENGISDGTNPGNVVTREQIVTMLWRYMKSPKSEGKLDGFADGAKVSAWAADALRWAVENGVLKGKDGNRLDPQGEATRAEVAVLLERLWNVKK